MQDNRTLLTKAKPSAAMSHRRWFRAFATGLVGLLVMLALAGCGGGDSSATATPVAQEASPTAAVDTDPTATPDAAGEAEPTATLEATTEPTTEAAPSATSPAATATSERAPAQATPTPAAPPVEEAEGAGRSNPVPFGQVGSNDEWEVQILEVVRGEEALAKVKEANQFNDDPEEGFEYVVLNLRAKYLGNDTEAQRVDKFWLSTTGDARVKWDFLSVVNPKPEFSGEVFTGGEVSGWVTTLAKQGEGNLMLIFERWLSFDDEKQLVLAIDEGARVEPATERFAEPNDAGLDRTNPIPLGERAAGETWEVWVIESIRGEEAHQILIEANSYNDPPEEGMEYVLVHVGARNITSGSEGADMNGFSFSLTGDAAKVHEGVAAVIPNELGGTVYPGGEIDGWVVLQCEVGETNLKLIYEPWLSFTAKPRYFVVE